MNPLDKDSVETILEQCLQRIRLGDFNPADRIKIKEELETAVEVLEDD